MARASKRTTRTPWLRACSPRLIDSRIRFAATSNLLANVWPHVHSGPVQRLPRPVLDGLALAEQHFQCARDSDFVEKAQENLQ